MAGADSEHSKCLLAPRAPGVSACALPIRAARPGIPSGNWQCPLLPVGIMTLHSGRPGRLGGLQQLATTRSWVCGWCLRASTRSFF